MTIEGTQTGDTVVDLDAQRAMSAQKGSCYEDHSMGLDLDSGNRLRVACVRGSDADIVK